MISLNILDLYLQQFIKRITKKSINDYKMSLDKQIKNIDTYINYLREKRLQLKKLLKKRVFRKQRSRAF